MAAVPQIVTRYLIIASLGSSFHEKEEIIPRWLPSAWFTDAVLCQFISSHWQQTWQRPSVGITKHHPQSGRSTAVRVCESLSNLFKVSPLFSRCPECLNCPGSGRDWDWDVLMSKQFQLLVGIALVKSCGFSTQHSNGWIPRCCMCFVLRFLGGGRAARDS